MESFITGIQQCGIGTHDAHEAALYYKSLFGLDALVFDDTAEAVLMKSYTGNEVQKRRAILTMNMQGGGGFELWQFLNRLPATPKQQIRLGDLGIFAIKLKCADVAAAFLHFSNRTDCSLSKLQKTTGGDYHFWLTDKYGNVFNLVKASGLFKRNGHICAGVCGAVIGVSNMEVSLGFYKNLLGVSTEVYNTASGGIGPVIVRNEFYHSVLLQKIPSTVGAFSQLLGDIIHLCFDVLSMDYLQHKANKLNYPFTVDSKNSFAMEKAGGRFCYVEDPDGTLIELVETHAVPIFKRIGWYLNLKKRKRNRPLPKWMIGMMGLSTIK